MYDDYYDEGQYGGDPEWARYNYVEPTPTPAAPTYSWWNDPDNPPPSWMLDLSRSPGTIGIPSNPGTYWDWDGDHWTMRPDPNYSQTGTTTTTPTTTTTTGGPTPTGGSDGLIDFGTDFGTYSGGDFNATLSPRATFGTAPTFTAPTFGAPPPFAYNKQFSAPTASELSNEPGFQFRLDQGRKALEQSAAGKGVLRTGGTLKDLINYGQNFASNEYGNAYNRKFNEYKFDYDKEADIYARNYGVSRDVFDRNYKGKYDEFQPQMTVWQTNANADQRAAELQFQREWEKYNSDRNYDLERLKVAQGVYPDDK
jgi:hypothetical protein